MTKRKANTTIIAIGLLISSLAASAQSTTVRATVDKSKILIGEPIHLRLEADIPETQPIRFFQFDTIAHFEFLNIDKIDTSNTSEGTVLTRLITITSFDSGHWVIPAFELGGKITTDTIPIDVGYTSPFDPNQPYHDVKDVIEVKAPEEKKKTDWWLYVIPAIVLLLVLIMILTRKKKKKPVPVVVAPPKDAYKEAMAALDKLRGEKNEVKQYYSRLVDIFRVYVAEKKEIHSLQQTSDDLILQLRNLNLPKERFETLSQSLRMSDFVKFAKYVPSEEDDRINFENIKKSIDSIEQIN